MSVRKQTTNRMTLIRDCGTCGKTITTTADTPWVRQTERDGKRQATTYFCSSACFKASYKHHFDGKAWERKIQRDSARDVTAKNRRYYETRAEQERERQRARYWADPEAARERVRYNHEKRRLASQSAICGMD